MIDHFHRAEDGNWSYRRAVGLKAKLAIPTIGATLKLADVDDRVELDK